MDLFDQETLLLVAALAAVGISALTIMVMSARARSSRMEAERLKAENSRLETQNRDQTRTVARLRNEQRSVSNFARSLPNVVRELNRMDLDPRSIPNLLIQLVEALFEPDQVLVYLVRSPGDEADSSKEIYLRSQRGLREVPDVVQRVRIGEGKIGWVAAHRVEMLAEDWLNLTRTEGRTMEDNHPSLRLDMIAPLVQHKGMKEHTLGVVCVGRPSVRPSDEKLMLQVVTNLGALALMNTRNVGKLAEQAHHDGLTALLNKNQFMFELGKLIYHAERSAQKLSVFIFDIDHFKAYNDANGHPAGDELLKSLARLIKENLRPGDMASRYGGEEFVVAMPETDGAAATQIAERIRQAIATHRFPHGQTQPGGRLTISGGVASFPVDGSNGTELIGHADQALYQAKAAGRNRVKRHRGVEIGDAAGRDEIDPYAAADPDPAVERPHR
jgi:diguanylate cyclase (GGDEF)-like protein